MTTKRPVTIAVAKGLLLDEALKLFDQLNIHFEEDLRKSRKLYTNDTTQSFRILAIRPWDVPEYVEQGAADLGIVGEDVLNEKGNPVNRLLDLNFGHCDLVIAGPNQQSPDQLKQNLRVATKFPNSTKRYFKNLGIKVKIIKLYGAIEMAPFSGLSDVICDLSATGKTIQENHLHIIDTIFKSSANLISNTVSLKFHYDAIIKLVDNLKKLTPK